MKLHQPPTTALKPPDHLCTAKAPNAPQLFLHTRGQQEPFDRPHTTQKLRYLSYLA